MNFDNAPLVRALIEARADTNARRDDGSTPLIYAATLGRLEAVRVLIESGVDLNARDKEGNTALDLVKTASLLGNLADSSRNLTPSELVEQKKYKAIIKLLKASGAQEKSPDEKSSDEAASALQRIIARTGSKNAQQRADAAETLGWSGDAAALEPLLKLLDDPEWLVRESAMLSLGDLWKGSDEVRKGGSEKIVAALLQDVSPLPHKRLDLRRDALDALADIAGTGDERATIALRGFLGDASPEVQVHAIQLVGRLGDREALPQLGFLTQNDDRVVEDKKIRDWAFEAIEAIEGRELMGGK
jgi:HEAT repeat protein